MHPFLNTARRSLLVLDGGNALAFDVNPASSEELQTIGSIGEKAAD